jgi:RNA polymerase sigma-70 factor, ECF subfamily
MEHRTALTREVLLKKAFRHQDALLTYAYGVTREWALAEDIVQNAFVTALEKSATYQEGTNFYAWIKAIVRLKALEMLRSRSREHATEDHALADAVDQALSNHLDEEAAQRQNFLMAHLIECLGRAGQSAIALLQGFYVEGKSYVALAESRNTQLETVRKQLYRLRKQLRDCTQKRQLEAFERGTP